MRTLATLAGTLVLCVGIPGGTIWLLSNTEAPDLLLVLGGLVTMGLVTALLARVSDPFVLEVCVVGSLVLATALLLFVY